MSEEEEERRISWKAVLLGFVTDVVGTFAASIALGFVIVAQGVRPQDANERMMQSDMLIVNLVMGFSFTAIGGFVAGRIAKQSEILHSALVGLIGISSGIVLSLPFLAAYPAWYTIISFAGIIPVAMFGGVCAAIIRPPTPDKFDDEFGDRYHAEPNDEDY